MAKLLQFSQLFNFPVAFILFLFSINKIGFICAFSQPQVELTGQNVCTFEEE